MKFSGGNSRITQLLLSSAERSQSCAGDKVFHHSTHTGFTPAGVEFSWFHLVTLPPTSHAIAA